MTSSSGRAPARARLAELMDGRRRDLRLKWDEVAARAGIHRETLRQIRIGGGDIRPLSATGIEDALKWMHGSIDTILGGGDPAPIEDKPAEQAKPELSVTELAQQLEQLKAEAARNREENNEIRKLLKQITGKDPNISGGEEPESEDPGKAM